MSTQSVPITPEQADAILLEIERRERAQSDLLAYTAYTMPHYQSAPHHRLIADALARLEAQTGTGNGSRLMIFAPPRHGKSELVSRRLPAYLLGRHPDWQIIGASYNDEFAASVGRDARNIVDSPEHQRIYPDCKLRPDSTSASRWHTACGGSYIGSGVGGSITGYGAHLAIIDDPVKSWEDADSEVVQMRIWHWYHTVLRTRLMPGGSIVLMLTRWHEQDLAGRLIESMESGGERWEILNLPAIAEHGDALGREVGQALWSEWYPVDTLESLRQSMPARHWSALYQQRPVPEVGALFSRDDFNRYRNVDINSLTVYTASDYAVSDNKGDFTEFGVWGVSDTGDLYALDWWYGQTAPDIWIDALLTLCQRWQPVKVSGESGVISKSVLPLLNQRMHATQSYFPLDWLPSINSKEARMTTFRAMAQQGKVHFPVGVSWADRVIDQLCSFPSGKHDDACDVCSMAARVKIMLPFNTNAHNIGKDEINDDEPHQSAMQGSWMSL